MQRLFDQKIVVKSSYNPRTEVLLDTLPKSPMDGMAFRCANPEVVVAVSAPRKIDEARKREPKCFTKLEIRIDEPDYTAIINEGQPVLGLNEIAELQQLAEAQAERLALALDSVRNNTSLVIVFRFQGQPCYFLGTLSGATGNLGSARTAPNSC